MVLWWSELVLLVLGGMLLWIVLVFTEGMVRQGQTPDVDSCGLIIEWYWQSHLLLRHWLG